MKARKEKNIISRTFRRFSRLVDRMMQKGFSLEQSMEIEDKLNERISKYYAKRYPLFAIRACLLKDEQPGIIPNEEAEQLKEEEVIPVVVECKTDKELSRFALCRKNGGAR